MPTRPISHNQMLVGGLLLIAMVISVALALTGSALFILAATLLVTVFAFYHGVLRYGMRAMAVFVAIVVVIGWSYETLSILTGFPFGSYYYTDVLGPKLWLVPVMIMPSYFAAGYFSWAVASVLIGKRDSGISGSDLWLLPIVSSFVMVMWDLSLDPLCATVSREWIWQDGGPFFGVPLTNFVGWFLCVFTFYFVFALYLRTARGEAGVIVTPGYWLLAILAYASMSLEVWGNWLLGKSTEITDKAGHVWQTGDIYGSMVLINVFTMLFVCLLGLVLIARDGAAEPAK